MSAHRRSRPRTPRSLALAALTTATLLAAPDSAPVPPVVSPPKPPVVDPPPAPKPDLVISAMGYNEIDKYFFTVTNHGAGAADALAQVAETDETNNTRSISEICLQ